MTQTRSLVSSIGIATGLILAAAVLPAFAASGGGGGSSGASTPVVCKAGWVYDKQKQICVPVQGMNDKDLYEQGRALALAGYYENALAALTAIQNQKDAMVLTMIGYSKRKMGAVDEGMAYYHRALAIDPNNVNTREYLGEGYVMIGRLDLAQGELDKIGAICGQTCEQYEDLAMALAGEPNW
jgi:tetratricopeptide (TPR) repeat protein